MILLAAPQYQVTLFFLPVPVVLKLWVVVLVLSEAKLFLLSNMRGAYGIVECPNCFCVLLVLHLFNNVVFYVYLCLGFMLTI